MCPLEIFWETILQREFYPLKCIRTLIMDHSSIMHVMKKISNLSSSKFTLKPVARFDFFTIHINGRQGKKRCSIPWIDHAYKVIKGVKNLNHRARWPIFEERKTRRERVNYYPDNFMISRDARNFCSRWWNTQERESRVLRNSPRTDSIQRYIIIFFPTKLVPV